MWNSKVALFLFCNAEQEQELSKVIKVHGTKENFLCLLLGLCSTPVFSYYGMDKFSTVYQWRFVEYYYDNLQQKEADLRSGNLIPDKPAIVDVDVYNNPTLGNKTVFVTIPRFQKGVPAALGTVVTDKYNIPYVKPYPSWDWFTEPEKCKANRIVSVYRIMIDECDRLWVLDHGQLDGDVICPPQVLAFDLKSNQLIHKYEIPRDQYLNQSTFVTPVVEVLSQENSCKNTFLYLADCIGNAIVVYDAANRKSWKVQHYTMYPDPDWAIYSIKGETFSFMDGVLGMALSPYQSRGGRKLFYHAMTSDTEHWVYTRNLQNETLATSDQTLGPSIFHTYKGRRGSQAVAQSIDKEGVMYFGLVSEIDIACFNTLGEYGRNCTSTDIVADNQETLQFASGVKVKTIPYRPQQLWVVTSRFQKVANGAVKNTEVNFRILVANVDALKMGKSCALPPSPYGCSGSAITFPSNK